MTPISFPAPEDAAGDSGKKGFALLSVILAVGAVSVLLAGFFAATMLDLTNLRATTDSATGFYSAEGGLNIRGEHIRSVFQGYGRPSGTSPDATDACSSGNLGSGDFDCRTFTFNGRSVRTYVVEDDRNNDPNDAERMITIPPGERFAGLNAIQYRYSVLAESLRPNDDRPEAILEMVFRTRLVPLFQFAAFYNKDLEILPGPNMDLAGPVHVNGDLYTNANNGSTLTITGEITVSELADGVGGGFWRGRKNTNDCTGTVRVQATEGATPEINPIPCNGSRRLVPQSELDAWNGRIETELETLTVPESETFDPAGMYWQQADLVVALDLRPASGTPRIIVPNRANAGDLNNITVNEALTSILEDDTACPAASPRSYSVLTTQLYSTTLHPEVRILPPLPAQPRAVEWSNRFRDRREHPDQANQRNAMRLMLEVDVQALMNCMHNYPELFSDGPSTEQALNDSSGGGLVWYLTVLGDHSRAASSGYGVRLRNGAYLGSTISGAPEIRGLTVVSDQAVFIQGNYNLNAGGGMGAVEWKPAAVLSDAINILSNNFAAQWNNHPQGSNANTGAPTAASNTTVQAAFMSGTRTTGNQEGTGGQGGAYNGGLENYPIFHEGWGGITLTYRGSFVSLDRPQRSTGAWGGHYYGAPTRNWGYESRFNNAENLPPLSPRFVYLLQERFVREFSR